MPASTNSKELQSKRGDHSTPSISSVSNGDVAGSSQQNGDAKRGLTPQISRASLKNTASGKPTSVLTTATNDAAFEVDWESESDPENPRNWSIWYKALAIGTVSWGTWVVVVYSTSYTTGLPDMQVEFNASAPVVTLGITTYLIGLATGSVILAPLSEIYGRRPIYIVAMFLFMVLVIPCGIAASLPEVLIVRFFGAVAGSAMIANSPGTVSDIVGEKYRALAFSIWSLGPFNGPVFGPIVGGFVTQYLGWRWTNWIIMIIAGIGWGLLCILNETYAPALLKRKARNLRKETGDDRYWSRYDTSASLIPLLRTNLSRPFVMAVTEPICIFWNLYIAVIYGILYLSFVAYPLVFSGLRNFSPGFAGLAFCGIGFGTLIVIVIEPLLRALIWRHPKDSKTGRPQPEAMVSIVCAAAVLVPVGQLWFAWTCAPPVHWIWPILAGIPFGAGTTGVFIYASNYLASSYGIYAASSMAGNSVVRSSLGASLPLAGPSMYDRLGPHWAGTVLGLAQVVIIPIPVVFYLYGSKIREKSALIRRMREDQERLEGKREKEKMRKDEEKAEEVAGEAGALGVEPALEEGNAVPISETESVHGNRRATGRKTEAEREKDFEKG